MVQEFQRARRPEQKEERRLRLLTVARAALVSGVAIEGLSLSSIARDAGMAKANTYRYFESREALLLALLRDEWRIWGEWLAVELPRIRRRDTVQVARLLAQSLSGRPLLCQLTAALPGIVERNLSTPVLLAFKQRSLVFFGDLAEQLHRVSPDRSASRWAGLLLDAAHLIMGLYPATHPAPNVVAVLDEPSLRFFKRDFGVDLERVFVAVASADEG